jgi:hypothetical protein
MWQIGGSCLLDVDVCGNGVINIGSYTSCFHVDVLSGLDPAWEKWVNLKKREITIVISTT